MSETVIGECLARKSNLRHAGTCSSVSKFTRRRAIGLATGAAFPSETGDAGNRGVDETSFVRIGGIDQWIAIQGRDVANPVLVFLHGGPGEAQSPYLKDFLPWEQDFTVVNWDPRGSGKTYGCN